MFVRGMDMFVIYCAAAAPKSEFQVKYLTSSVSVDSEHTPYWM